MVEMPQKIVCSVADNDLPLHAMQSHSSMKVQRGERIYCQYDSGGTFFVGFIIEYLEKLNAIILIIYSSQPFNVVCEHQVFALRGSD